ncbi:MAG TPA: cell division protein ZipA C-terminal FtsZ-binding domain-containing protein [Gallionella sp.]|nr:cell division protein ZipA C-terminal FtsZ-binding domain-containing protein [Gallionella sp.]
MSELQKALLAIGFGVIVAVYVYGWWQQRKYRQKFGAAFKSSHADALYQESPARPLPELENEPQALSPEPAPAVEHFVKIAEEAVEPVAAAVEPASEAQVSAETPVEEPTLGEEATEEQPLEDEDTPAEAHPAETAPVAQDESCALLDLRSDFIVELNLAEPSPASALAGLWQRKFDFGKPVLVCGLTLNAPRWERAVAEGATLYSRFRIALQLVDRGGAISPAKLADFRDLVLGIAARIKADANVPDMPQTHQNALELDAFCADVDQMVGVNLVVPGERLLSGTRIAEAAALQGLTLEADGAFHLLGAHGHSLFSLINMNSMPFQHHTLATHTTRGLTLLLDVPRVDSPAVQFDRMLAAAHGLARELQLNLVDDHRVVLSETGLARIRDQIIDVEAKMCEHGIAPGSAQARRLFA